MWSVMANWLERNFPNESSYNIIRNMPLPQGEVKSKIDFISWDGEGWVLGKTGCRLVISPGEHGTDIVVEKDGDTVCFVWLKEKMCKVCGRRSSEPVCPMCSTKRSV